MKFPLNLNFKIMAWVPQIYLRDSDGTDLFYVYQNFWKTKEKIHIYNNQKREQKLYEINADRIIDWSPRLDITDVNGVNIASMKRSGWKSILKNHWEMSVNEAPKYIISEENPWVKFFDGFVSDLPIIGLFTGFFFNPRYIIVDQTGEKVARITKKRSFLESNFGVVALKEISEEEKSLIAFTAIIVALFERRRG